MSLLLVFGAGDPVAEGIKMFPDKNLSANRLALYNDLALFAARARQYYYLPAALGGGGYSFVGLTCDAQGAIKLTGLANGRTANGTYEIWTAGTSNKVEIQGIGTTKVDGGKPLTIRMIVRDGGQPDSLYLVP
jgi:hypothetical protein